MSEFVLKCRVLDGMFSDELAVSYVGERPSGGFFVPRECVIERSGEHGKLLVRVIRRDHAVWAVIPTPQSDIIPVREVDLAPR